MYGLFFSPKLAKLISVAKVPVDNHNNLHLVLQRGHAVLVVVLRGLCVAAVPPVRRRPHTPTQLLLPGKRRILNHWIVNPTIFADGKNGIHPYLVGLVLRVSHRAGAAGGVAQLGAPGRWRLRRLIRRTTRVPRPLQHLSEVFIGVKCGERHSKGILVLYVKV